MENLWRRKNGKKDREANKWGGKEKRTEYAVDAKDGKIKQNCKRINFQAWKCKEDGN